MPETNEILSVNHVEEAALHPIRKSGERVQNGAGERTHADQLLPEPRVRPEKVAYPLLVSAPC